MLPHPPRPTLFPYTTLFRSHAGVNRLAVDVVERLRRAAAAGGAGRAGGRARRIAGMLAGSVAALARDRKSTRLNSSHVEISYAVFCLKKKKNQRSAIYQIRN